MFRSLEQGIRERVVEVLPQIGVGAFESEEERMKRESARAQRSTESTSGGTTAAPLRNEKKVGRNTLVTITDGTETKEMKYKKAEPLLKEGKWRMVA